MTYASPLSPVALGIHVIDESLYYLATNVEEVLKEIQERRFQILEAPTGFENRIDSDLYTVQPSYAAGPDELTVTVTHVNDFSFFVQGLEFVKTATDTVVISAPAEGVYWIYYDSVGTLTASVTPFDFADTTKAPVAVLHWDDSNSQVVYLGDERHGTVMDSATHSLLHDTVGTRYESGLTISGYVLSTDTNAAVTVGIAEGILHDEDIVVSIVDDATPDTSWEQDLSDPAKIPIFYRDGAAGNWRKIAATDYPFHPTGSGRLAYDNVGVGVAEGTNNYYIAYWIFATNDINNPIISIMGQRQDLKLVDAKANNTYESLAFGTLPFQEMKALYRIILQTKTVLTNAIKSTIEDVADYRALSTVATGTYVANSHSVLSDLSNDDHTQYLLADGTRALTGDWAVGAHAISGITTLGMTGQLTNTLAIGTPPFVITSTTVVPNLNVDKVDGYDLDQAVLQASSPTFAGLTVSGNDISGSDGIQMTMSANGVKFLGNIGIAGTTPNAAIGIYDYTAGTGYWSLRSSDSGSQLLVSGATGFDAIFLTREGTTNRLSMMYDASQNDGRIYHYPSTAHITFPDGGGIEIEPVGGVLELINNELDMTGALACIDLNPAGTGSKTIIDITPSASLVAGSVWDGVSVNVDALDPATGAASTIRGFYVYGAGLVSVDNNATLIGFQFAPSSTESSFGFAIHPREMTTNKQFMIMYSYSALVLSATATYRGWHQDWSGVTRDAGAPVLIGINAFMPADYTGFGACYAAYFSGDGRSVKICDTTYALNVAGAMLLNGVITGINSITLDAGTTITEFSLDGTLAGNSDDALPTEQAVKTYVDAQIAAVNSLAEVLVLGNEADGTDILLDQGADLIVYSDDKVTEVARIDGATGNITTIGTVDTVDIAALKTDVDGFPDELKSLVTAEIQQLENIDASTISVAQWGYLGALDQALTQASSPTFVGLTLSGVITGVTTISAGGTYFQVDASGNTLLSVADATAILTMQDSATLELKGKYWTGTVSADVAMLIGTDVTVTTPEYEFFIKREDLTKVFSVDEAGNGMFLGDLTVANIITTGLVDGVDVSAIVAFRTITGITNDVVADSLTDSLTLATANNLLTIVGTTATDTITFTIVEANISHDSIADVSVDDHHSEVHVLGTSGPHSGTLPLADLAVGTQGSIIRRGVADWEELVLGTLNYALVCTATDVVWAQYDYSWLANIPSTFTPSSHGESAHTGDVIPDADQSFTGNLTITGAISGVTTLSAGGTYFTVDASGNVMLSIADATAILTMQDSATLELKGKYWTGAATVDVAMLIGTDVTVATPEYEFFIKREDLTKVFSVDELGNGMVLGDFTVANLITAGNVDGVDVSTFKTAYDAHVAASDLHVAHSGVSIIAGTGLSGGGTIAASRTINCDITQYTDGLARTACLEDDVYGVGWDADVTHAPTQNAVYDKINAMDTLIAANTTTAEVEAIITAELVDGQSIDLAIDALINTHNVADNHIAHSGVTITAGTGLSGGGTIAATRTINCDITQYTDALARTACVSDVAYGVAWNAVTTIAPSKNAIYDQLVTHYANTDEHHAQVHTHDGDTLQLDGINSDGGAFAFTTSGVVQFNNALAGITDLSMSGQLDMTGAGAWIDLNPAGTGTQDIIQITPSAALAAGSIWTGISQSLGALDPATGGVTIIRGFEIVANFLESVDGNLLFDAIVTNACPADDTNMFRANVTELTADKIQIGFLCDGGSKNLSATGTYQGLHIDWDGITRDLGAPVLQGARVQLPVDYANFGVSYAGYFSGDGRSVTICDTTYALDVSGIVRVVGDVTVSNLITAGNVDGVDVSAHAADSDIHTAHSGVSITAGTGLSGGGTIAASRTINCDITQYTNAMAVAAVVAQNPLSLTYGLTVAGALKAGANGFDVDGSGNITDCGTIVCQTTTVTGNVLPEAADTRFLGSTTREWNRLYIGNTGGIYFGTTSDVRVYWYSANVLGIADDVRCHDLTPISNNIYTLGSSSSMKWLEIFVSTITTGDIHFANNFRLREVRHPDWDGNPNASDEEMYSHSKADGATPGLEFYNNRGEMIALLDEDGDFHVRGKIHEYSSIFN